MRLSSSAKTNSVTTLTSAIWNASDSEENNHSPPLLQGTSDSHYYLLQHIPLEADREDPLFSELFEGNLIK